ncbi:S41 family peptidase [Pararhodonellum marinum]|uniref:S41 family peptidase n=1 Tax=Pararhodonellum marinum TaxID=2755358 RepID=UPI001E374B05|nr:S41 family peptidase [Pararhodonellum marinum]
MKIKTKFSFSFSKWMRSCSFFFIWLLPCFVLANGTRLLQQPDVSQSHIAFVYGADIWLTGLQGGEAKRLTSTAAIEKNPKFSPDGNQIAFSSNRTGTFAVYVVSVEGGTPRQLTWHPSSANVVGWTPDGTHILYETNRDTAPVGFSRLWKVPLDGGPSEVFPLPRGVRAAYLGEDKMVVEPISRWDVTWRAYRGGQNTSLIITDLNDLSEIMIPNERTTDIHPVVLNGKVFFLSDRNWVTNVWSYDPANETLVQETEFEGSDIMWLSGNGEQLIYEKDGMLYLFDPQQKNSKQIEIEVKGDFPWAEPRLENVTSRATNASLSPNGKRILLEARGEIFTVPVEDGSPRNLSRSSDAADRNPIWSPKGDQVVWFSDEGGKGYQLMIADQEGLEDQKKVSLGEAKMVWEPTWSPDGKSIAFVDNKVYLKILDVASGEIKTIDSGGINIERGNMKLEWSPDSQWLSYSKTGPNMFRRIYLWSMEKNETKPVTNNLADSFSATWDASGKYLYFLASTNLALGSGWANTSSISAEPEHAAYLIVLSKEEKTPFPLKSDEEEPKKEDPEKDKKEKEEGEVKVKIDWEGIEERTLSLSIPVKPYNFILAGKKGTAFIGEASPNGPGVTLHKFTIEGKKFEEFTEGINRVKISHNREKLLFFSSGNWKVVQVDKKPDASEGLVKMELRMELDRKEEWKQIFNEAWRYEKDYFYDSSTHGRDWNDVLDRYSPLVPYIQHRNDLTYLLDQLNGELSVGHSFVFGGDFPAVDTIATGLLGADYEIANGKWRIKRIYTAESWNPNLKAPLSEPGLEIKPGDYILSVNGQEVDASTDIYEAFKGTSGKQTIIHVHNQPQLSGARKLSVSPIGSEAGLRQRAWVEDNRRKVDELSDGKLAYVWVPNTGGSGFTSFNRYFFAQQDKLGAVIDERFNGGGLLDDYMVDLMTRTLRAAITNEVPNPRHFQLPAGILGPKVLLINELAGSGGDYFPWVFRNQKAGPLIGKRTWGGLVKSSVHYSFIDGGAMTSPDNAVFDPIRNEWIGENKGIAPDIEVHIDAVSHSEGRDVQLERGVEEVLKLIETEGPKQITPPPFPKPATKPGIN